MSLIKARASRRRSAPRRWTVRNGSRSIRATARSTARSRTTHSRGEKGQPAVDAANPRANNVFGHIIRWMEDGDFDAPRFTWDLFALAGDPRQGAHGGKGQHPGRRLRQPGRHRGSTPAACSGSRPMYRRPRCTRATTNAWATTRCSPATRDRRDPPLPHRAARMRSDRASTCTPDGRTLFVNIQHPGESPSERSDPADPSRFSAWPTGWPTALGDGRDPQERWRRDRDLIQGLRD